MLDCLVSELPTTPELPRTACIGNKASLMYTRAKLVTNIDYVINHEHHYHDSDNYQKRRSNDSDDCRNVLVIDPP